MKAGAAAVTARTGIPTGTQCTVSESLPNPPTGWSFGTPTYDPSATVTIATKDQVVTVTVQNTLTRDTGSLKVAKTLTGGPAPRATTRTTRSAGTATTATVPPSTVRRR